MCGTIAVGLTDAVPNVCALHNTLQLCHSNHAQPLEHVDLHCACPVEYVLPCKLTRLRPTGQTLGFLVV